MISKNQVLSNDFLVCLKIFEFNEVRGEKIWFSKLVREMNGEPTQSTISKCLDRLSDLGIIEGDWEHVGGYWTRTLRVSDDLHGFVKGLYDATESCSNQQE